MEDIKVSICCITYNHENYISDAIESFLMQVVDFPIEIIIHDDASTDHTAKIIKEYENKYPDIIKPVFQKVNQYSKKIKILSTYVFPIARGKYIAVCEGDDYWTDPYKLQEQINYLDNHSNCSVVVHGSILVGSKNKKTIKKIRPAKANKMFNVEEVILGGGGLFATNSMVFRSKYVRILPAFYNNYPIGDYPMIIFLSLMGEVYYINKVMSAYRYLVPGSWSSVHSNSIRKQIENFENVSNILDEVDLYSDYKYSSVIRKRKAINRINLLIVEERFEEAKKDDMFNYYLSISLKNRLRINMKQYCPNLFGLLKKIGREFFNAKPKH